jgi:hypothetical protein
MSSSRLFESASWRAGATSPPPRMAMPTPRWTAPAGRKAPSCQKPLSSGASRSAKAVALRRSAAGSSLSVTGRSRFARSSQASAAERSIGVAR